MFGELTMFDLIKEMKLACLSFGTEVVEGKCHVSVVSRRDEVFISNGDDNYYLRNVSDRIAVREYSFKLEADSHENTIDYVIPYEVHQTLLNKVKKTVFKKDILCLKN